MMARRRSRLAAAAGFLGALVVLGVLVTLVGAERVGAALLGADPALLLATLAFGAGWLTAWGLLLSLVLRSLDVAVSNTASVLLFVAATFANNVSPFGQAGGEPITALMIGRATDADYRVGLVSIASVDALNVASSLTLALVGLLYYASTTTLGSRLRVLAAVTVGAAILVPLLWLLAWRRRRVVVGSVARALVPVAAVVSRVVPRLNVGEATVRGGLEDFVADVERLGTEPRTLAAGFGLSALGWLLQVAVLSTAFHALGSGVDPAPLLFVVPLANAAGSRRSRAASGRSSPRSSRCSSS